VDQQILCHPDEIRKSKRDLESFGIPRPTEGLLGMAQVAGYSSSTGFVTDPLKHDSLFNQENTAAQGVDEFLPGDSQEHAFQ